MRRTSHEPEPQQWDYQQREARTLPESPTTYGRPSAVPIEQWPERAKELAAQPDARNWSDNPTSPAVVQAAGETLARKRNRQGKRAIRAAPVPEIRKEKPAANTDEAHDAAFLQTACTRLLTMYSRIDILDELNRIHADQFKAWRAAQ